MVINQGDVFLIERMGKCRAEQARRRPYVVVQNNLANQTRINTVLVCGLTTNLQRARAMGNVIVDEGEANLPRRSVVNVSQMLNVDRSRLTEKVGSLTAGRVREIIDGIILLIEPKEPPNSVEGRLD